MDGDIPPMSIRLTWYMHMCTEGSRGGNGHLSDMRTGKPNDNRHLLQSSMGQYQQNKLEEVFIPSGDFAWELKGKRPSLMKTGI